MYRKGGRYGPYWFAYDDVTKESPWRPIDGAFTRFGDVLPLLAGSRRQYIVMAPGDETTIEFDASSAKLAAAGLEARLPAVHRWVDQGLRSEHCVRHDGRTRCRSTACKSYPYGPAETYPTDPLHQRYLRDYNTRVVKGREREEYEDCGSSSRSK